MNDFTKEEKLVYKALEKPLLSFDEIQVALDKEAQRLGYENHQDLLIKTGWTERFL